MKREKKTATKFGTIAYINNQKTWYSYVSNNNSKNNFTLFLAAFLLIYTALGIQQIQAQKNTSIKLVKTKDTITSKKNTCNYKPQQQINCSINDTITTKDKCSIKTVVDEPKKFFLKNLKLHKVSKNKITTIGQSKFIYHSHF